MDRLEALRRQVEELAREMRDVQRRLAVLESRKESPADGPEAANSPFPPRLVESAAAELSPATLSAKTVSFLGRTLIVLGGAYLLRAVTDAALVAPLAGAVAGLTYAAAWLVLAHRVAASGRRASAVFHGLAALFIAYPLLWETTTRWQALSAGAAAAGLVGFHGFGLIIAWRRRLIEVAWTNTLLAAGTALILFAATHALLTFDLALFCIAITIEALALGDRWRGLRWVPALGLDLSLLVTADLVARPGGLPQGYPPLSAEAVIAAALALPGLYLVSIAIRTLVRLRKVSPFEFLQAAAALGIGFGVALSLSESAGRSPTSIHLQLLLLGVAGYAVAFAFIDRRMGRGRNLFFYTTFAAATTLAGSYLILEQGPLAIAWGIIAVVALWLGGLFDRIALRWHGVVYLVAATVAVGLLSASYSRLLGPLTSDWGPLTTWCLIVSGIAVAGYAILVVTRRGDADFSALLPQMVLAALVVWILGAVAIEGLGRTIANAKGGETDAAFLAASRTGVLSVLAVGIAWLAPRHPRWELAWLAYPLLVGEAIRLVLEDIRYGRPLTLFITFGLYGAALIITPRLMRKEA